MNQKSSKSTSIVKQVALLPVILTSLMLISGIIGIVVSTKLLGKIVEINDSALSPAIEFSNVSEYVNDINKMYESIADKNDLVSKTKSIKKIKSVAKKVDKSIQARVEMSKGKVFEQYLDKLKVSWTQLQADLNQIDPATSTFDQSLDDRIIETNEELHNITSFIQADSNEKMKETQKFANQVILYLGITVVAGLIFAILFSLFVLKKIKILVENFDTARRNIENMLNSLDQGYFTIEKDGTIQSGVSDAAKRFFGKPLENMKFIDSLPVSDEKKAEAQEWFDFTFENKVPFSSMKDLGPSQFVKDNRIYELEYKPIFKTGTTAELKNIICVTSDKTEYIQMQDKALNEQALVKMVTYIIKDREGFSQLLAAMNNLIDESLVEIQSTSPDVSSLLRQMHTIKGAAATIHIIKVVKKAHQIESLFTAFQDGSMKMVDQLTNVKSQLKDLKDIVGAFLQENKDVFELLLQNRGDLKKEVPVLRIMEFLHLLKNNGSKNDDLYKKYLEFFILGDMSDLFKRYKETVLELNQLQNKSAQLVVTKSGILVDPKKYQNLANSFVHAVRNSMDHGIESSDERVELEKSGGGLLEFHFTSVLKDNNKWIQIRLKDDGRGIDASILKSKAIEKGIWTLEEANELTEHDILQVIFKSGFSTTDAVSELSGRGVGADAIMNEAKNLNGTAWVESIVGKGTTFVIEVPFHEEFT